MFKGFSTKKLAVSGVSLALAFVLSFIVLFHMPTGGSVTLLSMLFVVIIGYFYGPAIGFAAAFAYALLQFFQNRDSLLSLWQVLFDYFLAFTALGTGSLFHKKKYGLVIGYSVAVLLRLVFTTAASVLFWSEYLTLPASIGNKTLATVIAALIYNASYILTEGAVTVVLLLVPPVRKAIDRVKRLANS